MPRLAIESQSIFIVLTISKLQTQAHKIFHFSLIVEAKKKNTFFLKLYLLATNSNYGMPPITGKFHTGVYSTRNAFFHIGFSSSHLPSQCDATTLSPSPTLISVKLLTGTSRINQTSILVLKRFILFPKSATNCGTSVCVITCPG